MKHAILMTAFSVLVACGGEVSSEALADEGVAHRAEALGQGFSTCIASVEASWDARQQRVEFEYTRVTARGQERVVDERSASALGRAVQRLGYCSGVEALVCNERRMASGLAWNTAAACRAGLEALRADAVGFQGAFGLPAPGPVSSLNAPFAAEVGCKALEVGGQRMYVPVAQVCGLGGGSIE